MRQHADAWTPAANKLANRICSFARPIRGYSAFPVFSMLKKDIVKRFDNMRTAIVRADTTSDDRRPLKVSRERQRTATHGEC